MKSLIKIIYFLFFGLPLLILPSCSKVSTNPGPSDAGWAVGLMQNNSISILHTENGGKDWVSQTQLCTGFTDFQGISAVSEDVAWAVGGKANGYGVVIRTRDKGVGWCRVGKSSDIPDVVLYAVHAYDVDQAWIAGEKSTLLHTTDGGLTWFKPDLSQLPLTNFSAFSQCGKDLWVSGTTDEDEGVIIRSSDAGNHWQRIGAGPVTGPVNDIQAITQNLVVACGPHSVFITTDGGSTWNMLFNLPSLEIRDFCATDVNHFYLVTSCNTIYRSSDQGKNWLSLQLPMSDAGFNGSTGMSNGSFWVVGQKKDQSSAILFTADGGQTWTEGKTDAQSQLKRISLVSGVK